MNGVELILAALLVVCGYFVAYQIAAANVKSRRILPAVAIVTLIMYASVIGVVALLYFYSGNDPIIIFGSVLMFAMIGLVMLIWFCFKHSNSMESIPVICFLVYAAFVAYLTLYIRVGTVSKAIQMEPFRRITEAMAKQDWSLAQHDFENMLMFVPLGVLLPLMNRRHFRHFAYAFLAGLILSTGIETTQYLLHLGECDIDDIIANTAGAVVGYGGVSFWLAASRNWRI